MNPPSFKAIAAIFCIAWIVWIPRNSCGLTAVDEPGKEIPPEVDIRIEAMPKIAYVGDPIRIELDVSAPEPYQVEIPRPGPQIGDFAVLDFFPGPTVPDAGEPWETAEDTSLNHHRARILTAVYKTGKFVFPAVRIKLKTAEGKEVSLASDPINIEIQSILPDKNAKLKNLKKQAEMSEPVHWILWLIAVTACFILGFFLWRYWKKRRNVPPSSSPEQLRNALDLAEADLRDLLAHGLPDRGKAKQFYILLSEIIKRILEAAYEIPTAERTTLEIMDLLRLKPNTEPETVQRIESFLLRCDAVKFAKYIPSGTENEAVSKDAVQILADAKSSRQSAAVSGQ
jgi:hypothetical protein